jgi:hypothetical protein
MIYATQIEIPNRAVWGNVHSKEVLLPAKIRRINGYFANVVLGDNTRLLRCKESKMGRDASGNLQYNEVTYNVGSETITINELQVIEQLSAKPMSAQVANYSLSINNTNIVVDCSPLLVVNVLNRQGIGANLIRLPKPVMVDSGSFLRLVIDETMKTPLVDALAWDNMSAADKEAYYGAGYANITPTNNYTANIYLDYD